jgi:hypothetical protein
MTSSTIKPSLSGSPHIELVDAWALIPDVDPDYDARIEAALRRLPSKTRGKGVAMEGRIPLRVDLCRKCQRGKRGACPLRRVSRKAQGAAQEPEGYTRSKRPVRGVWCAKRRAALRSSSPRGASE